MLNTGARAATGTNSALVIYSVFSIYISAASFVCGREGVNLAMFSAPWRISERQEAPVAAETSSQLTEMHFW